ncbi:MAG TPA: hypothetical protein VM791_08760 [Vicinamibacterales bacterium]|jgi:hypothetical protein|nr:hypothetical protein [Vicinamibacterales bacterium]
MRSTCSELTHAAACEVSAVVRLARLIIIVAGTLVTFVNAQVTITDRINLLEP